ncbi:DEKNAAC101392 [Brettanomyces naardenensis]|uniref:DEKNAAC101392 n=1 Tax=Brettanomyces naardenensis TaxID=13370 RepID=A0A448YHU3_BRENA|nr:DEKNAAC101392 [Brettanomyces naardenensis]
MLSEGSERPQEGQPLDIHSDRPDKVGSAAIQKHDEPNPSHAESSAPSASGQAEALAHYQELRKLYHEPTPLRKFIYDLILWIFQIVFDCFFREIRPRGAFRLPKSGPVIFVAAPHANQFVDPIVLQTQVKKETGRRISFLIADKSHRRRFIGLVSRSQLSIPVKRAQDNLKLARGKARLDPEDPLHIIGDENTVFTEDCQPKGLIALPKSLGVAQVSGIVSNSELYLRKPFRYTNEETRKEGERLFSQGTIFKTAAKIDQSEVYAMVFEHLSRGHCLGVFSEGGSHDRPDLLPFKAGVAIMALGAMDANPGCSVKIVPCGMNYFHPHKFRSRAVVEFGMPIEIDQSLVDRYADPTTTKDAIRDLLDTITKAIKAVTVTCPDYETLMVIQAARRLYSNSFSSELSLPAIVEMNRRLLNGYQQFKDEPRIRKLREAILQYNLTLRSLHIPDHLVERQTKERIKIVVFMELLGVLAEVALLGILALPGGILFSPVFITAKRISERKRQQALAGSTVKIRAKDVIATWKILVSIGLAPILYTSYSTLGSYLLRKYWNPDLSVIKAFILFYALSVALTYSALVFGDRGMDLIYSIRPLWLMLVNSKGFDNLQQQRRELSKEITSVINELGPDMYPDFNLKNYKEAKNHDREDIEEYEEGKTQRLRRRRQARRAKKEAEGKIPKPVNVADIQILPDDSSTSSGIGISSASTSDLELSSSSESEYDYGEEDKPVASSINLVRDQIINDNRKRDK